MEQEEIRDQRNAYLLRGLVGPLILYYAVNLFRNLAAAEGTKWYVLLVFAVVFSVAGAALLIIGIAGFAKYAKLASVSGSNTTDETDAQEGKEPETDQKEPERQEIQGQKPGEREREGGSAEE